MSNIVDNNPEKYQLFKKLLREVEGTGGALRLYLRNGYQITGTFHDEWDGESFWFKEFKTGKDQLIFFDVISTAERA